MRLHRHGVSVLLAAVAAALAYSAASWVFGAQNAFFAPIAAVIIVGLGRGHRLQRSLEIGGGVLVGVVAGESVSLLGLPIWLTLGLTVALGMGLAVSLRATALFTNQAAVAAVVTMIIAPIMQAPPFSRVGDALIGGIVALAVTVPARWRPQRHLAAAVRSATDELAATVDDVAAALRDESADLDAAVRDVIGATDSAGALDEAIRAARESARVGRQARALSRTLVRAARVRDQWFSLVASLVLLARTARSVRRTQGLSVATADRVAELAAALRQVGRWAAESEPDRDIDAARAAPVALARSLTADLRKDPSTAEQVLLVAARTAVVDLLRILGSSHSEAVEDATA